MGKATRMPNCGRCKSLKLKAGTSTAHCTVKTVEVNLNSQGQSSSAIGFNRSYEILEVTSRRTSLVGGKCMGNLMLSARDAPGNPCNVTLFVALPAFSD